MSKVMKGTFMAVACLIGTVTFTGSSQAGVHLNGLVDNALVDNSLADNALVDNAIGPNSFGGKARGEADMAGMALNGIRLDSTTLKTVPGPAWAKDVDPPSPD